VQLSFKYEGWVRSRVRERRTAGVAAMLTAGPLYSRHLFCRRQRGGPGTGRWLQFSQESVRFLHFTWVNTSHIMRGWRTAVIPSGLRHWI